MNMRRLIAATMLWSSCLCVFAGGIIQTEKADGSFATVESSSLVDGCVVTKYLDGTQRESFEGGKIVNTYYKNGKLKSAYLYNGGNEKFYVFDEITGIRSEPKYPKVESKAN
jgi:hypothetical protein